MGILSCSVFPGNEEATPPLFQIRNAPCSPVLKRGASWRGFGDTTLVAPVTVGDHAYTGAGAVVNRDVPPHALVVGVPARLLRVLQQTEDAKADGGEKE